MTTRRVWLVAALGWALFALTLWYDHRPQPPEAVPPVTANALHKAGFDEANTSTVPPPSVITRTQTIPGAERLVYVEVAAPPTETEPPSVRFVAGNCGIGAAPPEGPQVTNWTLRPGDLGMRDGTIDVRKAGRHGFVKFEATLTAQTPDGTVERPIAPHEDAWLSTKALGIPPRLGPMFRVTTLPTVEGGIYWTKGRAQYDASIGRDLNRDEWFVGGGVRF